MKTESERLKILYLAAEDRANLQKAINYSLAYLNSPGQGATSANRRYPLGSITKDQVIRSLHALTELLQNTTDEAQFNATVRPLKVSEYVALAELGAFDNERVELLRGRVVRMAPQGEEHAWIVQTMTVSWSNISGVLQR